MVKVCNDGTLKPKIREGGERILGKVLPKDWTNMWFWGWKMQEETSADDSDKGDKGKNSVWIEQTQ